MENEEMIYDVIDEMVNTVVFTPKSVFVPLLNKLIGNKKLIKKTYIVESDNLTEFLFNHFNNFDHFIIVNYPLSKFEKEFLNQLVKKKNGKSKIYKILNN